MVETLKKNFRGLPENMRKHRDKIGEDIIGLRGKRREVDTAGGASSNLGD